MDVWTLMRTALRRWYVFIPVVGASLGLGYTMASELEPVYTAESSAILTAPEIVPGQGLQAGELLEVNPFLSLGGGLQTTTQVMVVLMDSEPQRLAYADLGLEVDYEVSRDDAVIFFTVTGADEENVIRTAETLIGLADGEIEQLQDKAVPAEQRIRVRPLSVPEVATEDGGAGTQLLAVLGLLGIVAGLASALALDGFLTWRRNRNLEHEQEEARHPAPQPRPVGPDAVAEDRDHRTAESKRLSKQARQLPASEPVGEALAEPARTPST